MGHRLVPGVVVVGPDGGRATLGKPRWSRPWWTLLFAPSISGVDPIYGRVIDHPSSSINNSLMIHHQL
eukprot:2925889-Prymnesium_polylepis.2